METGRASVSESSSVGKREGDAPTVSTLALPLIYEMILHMLLLLKFVDLLRF